MMVEKTKHVGATKDARAPRPSKIAGEQRTSVELPNRFAGSIWHPSKKAGSKSSKHKGKK